MSFAIGLSGLNAASANLKVIGDNIANMQVETRALKPDEESPAMK